MKTTIVNSSQLGTGCWSAKRFTDGCCDCRRVETCDLPEAAKGKIKLFEAKLTKNKKKLDEDVKKYVYAQIKLAKMKKELST